MSEIHPPDLLALLRASKEAPDDDGPRHVLADWLDDHGFSDRAECVRLSLRLAALEALRYEGLVEFGAAPGNRWRVRLVVPVAS